MTATYVLVPGAGGEASYWHLVQELLAAHGVESVAVSLPGGDPTKGLPDYVDLVVAAASGIDEVVLVGQSLGGFSASWAAEIVRPKALVLVNAMIPLPGETAGEWWDATGSGAARIANDLRHGRDPDGPFDLDLYFFHDVPPESLPPSDEPPEETDTVFVAPWGPTAWPEVPTRVLVGDSDRFFPPDFQRRVARERLGIDVEMVPGGHLPALSHPDELVAALLSGT